MISMDLLRFCVAIPFFIYASYLDLKERLISTWIWLLLGTIAFAINFYIIGTELWAVVSLIIAMFIFYEWFFEWEGKEKLIIKTLNVLTVPILIYITYLNPALVTLTLISFLMLFFKVLYTTKIVKGRADARAMMTIAVLQPTYPHYDLFGVHLPILVPKYVEIAQITFPFVFIVLLYSGVGALFFIIGMAIRNALRGDIGFPEMFIGYRMDLDKVPHKHVWLMERIENDEHVLYIHPRDHTEEDIEKLKKRGISKVWVQPKIPYVVFITAGVFAAYILGCVI